MGTLLPLVSHAATITVTGKDSAAISTAITRAAAGDTVRFPAGTYLLTEAVRPKSGLRLVGDGVGRTILHFTGTNPAPMMDLSGCEDTQVAGMTLDGRENPKVQQGVFASNAQRLRLRNLRIANLVKSEAFGPHGVYFTGSNPTGKVGVTDSEITECTLDNIGIGAAFGGGIRFAWGSSRNTVLRCTIRNTGRGGIFANNGSTDSIVRENNVTGSRGEGLGIEMWGGCDRSIIEDNRVDHWISLDRSGRTAVRRNTVRDSSGDYKLAGLELVGSSFSVFTGNVVDGGQNIGISVSNQPEKNYIYWGDNQIRRCNQWGAQIQGESGGAGFHYFYRCSFSDMRLAQGKVPYPGEEGHGFRINGNAHHLTFEKCTFQDNARLGLQLGGRGVDFLSFVGGSITGNGGAAVSGLKDYSALEWKNMTVKQNGSDALPPPKPFPHPAPVAGFTVPASARVGKPVSFRSMARAQGPGKIVQVLWDFDHGVPATQAALTHTFDKPGTYRVTLLVWDEQGRGARLEKSLRILP